MVQFGSFEAIQVLDNDIVKLLVLALQDLGLNFFDESVPYLCFQTDTVYGHNPGRWLAIFFLEDIVTLFSLFLR